MLPLIGSALIGGAASLLGNLFGFGSNKSTNDNNLKIAQMNNEFNERMLDKQMQYNTDMYNQAFSDQSKFSWDMWRANADYNSASSQVQRLRDAGLNPYLMMNGGNAGSASAVNMSGVSANGVNPPQAQQVQMQPFRPDLSGLGGIISTLIDAQAQKGVRDATRDQLNIQNHYLSDMLMAQIANMQQDTFTKKSQEKLNNMNFARLQSLLPSEINKYDQDVYNAKLTGQLIQAQTLMYKLQGSLSQKELQYFDDNALADLSIKAAQQYSLVASGQASEAQAKNAIANSLESYARTNGIKIENHVKSALINTTIGTARQLYRKSIYDAKQSIEESRILRKDRKWYWYNNTLRPLIESVVPMTVGFGLGRIGKASQAIPHVKGFRR